MFANKLQSLLLLSTLLLASSVTAYPEPSEKTHQLSTRDLNSNTIRAEIIQAVAEGIEHALRKRSPIPEPWPGKGNARKTKEAKQQARKDKKDAKNARKEGNRDRRNEQKRKEAEGNGAPAGM